MAEKEDLTECFTCRKSFPSNQKRLSPYGHVVCADCYQKIADAKNKRVKLDLAKRVLELKKPPEEMTADELDAVITHYQEEAKASRWIFLFLPVCIVIAVVFTDFSLYALAGAGVALVAGMTSPYYSRKAKKLREVAERKQSSLTIDPGAQRINP